MPKSLEKSLLDITNAYLAVEDLLKSDLLTPQTRGRLEKTLKILDRESAKLMREHAGQDHAHGDAEHSEAASSDAVHSKAAD